MSTVCMPSIEAVIGPMVVPHGIVFFDYAVRKPVPVPPAFVAKAAA